MKAIYSEVPSITGGQFTDGDTPEIKVRANVRIQNIEVLIIGCLCNIT